MTNKAKQKKILAVDDEQDILWSLQEFLVDKSMNAEIVTASSGEEALKILKSEPIDLVISDIKMPGISGLELLDEIKNNFPLTTVIIMTAFPSSEFKRKATLKGGAYFLEKPFDIALLREKVKTVLNETNQFKGMLTGISLADVIQIKCMSGTTGALRVSEGDSQGVIYFDNGDIIHGICDDLEGIDAIYRILSFNQGRLDTLKSSDLPERTIKTPYAAILIESARRLDENDSGDSSAENEDIPETKSEHDTSPIDTLERKHSLIMDDLRNIKGVREAAIISLSKEIIRKEVVSPSSFDIATNALCLCEFCGEAFEKVHEIGYDHCQEILIAFDDEILTFFPISTGDALEYFLLVIFEPKGNIAMGRTKINKYIRMMEKDN